MKITRDQYPQWLLDASIHNEEVSLNDGAVIWECGTWLGGTWLGGIWKGGIWKGGIWEGGTWKGGIWEGGTWKGGTWEGGIWEGGIWKGGTWFGGTWEGGIWEGGIWKGGTWFGGTWLDEKIDRKIYMLARIGIVFVADGILLGYRKTRKNGDGCYNELFKQLPGTFFIEACFNDGITCRTGIHVCSLFLADHYFGRMEGDELWEVSFTLADVCGFDDNKVKLRSGFARRIPWPWARK